MIATQKSRGQVVKATYVTFAALMCSWIFAWLLKISLDNYLSWLTTSLGSFVYWVIAKVFIWILPALKLINLSGRKLTDVFNFGNRKASLLWGGGIGFLIASTGFIPNYLAGNPILPREFSIPLFSVLTVAPVFEEFLMRGALLGNLQQGYPFFTANIITSVMFVVLHLPGWYFMGNLVDMLSKPVGGALSIFLLSLALGYITRRSDSVVGAMFAHFLNNLS